MNMVDIKNILPGSILLFILLPPWIGENEWLLEKEDDNLWNWRPRRDESGTGYFLRDKDVERVLNHHPVKRVFK